MSESASDDNLIVTDLVDFDGKLGPMDPLIISISDSSSEASQSGSEYSESSDACRYAPRCILGDT